jgi:phosphate starvation-inducible PhoH-like protein
MEMTIQVASHEEAMTLFGLGDRNLKLLREAFNVQVTGRGTTLRLTGAREPVEKVAGLLNDLVSRFRSGAKIPKDHLERQIAKDGRPGAIDSPASSNGERGEKPAAPEVGSPRASEPAEHRGTGPTFEPGLARSRGQESYLDAILKNEIVFCIGPAGTGKTFLAVRMAVSFLREGVIKRIILCRPAVEAGEKLGFLPGDFQAKINPYLRPLYDALNDILDYDQVKRYLEREIIEILPLAYMRGRTLNNAFIILDEGQNTSISQMKMFLTRMGMSSRIVVNGDVTQVDLPEGTPSGLIHAHRIIRNITGVAWVELQKTDIVRHPLVRKIVEAYEIAESDSH